jgi:N-acetylmuramoyl-L-alanine amidase
MNRRVFIRQSLCVAVASAVELLQWSPTAVARQLGTPSHQVASRPRGPRTIVIDPGHGGVDPGAIGHTGIEEKNIVLPLAKEFAARLRRLTGATVHLTRDRDIFLPLAERVAIGENLKADLFISVHADSCPDHKARGLSIYTLSEVASDELSASLAVSENRVDALYGNYLKHVLKHVNNRNVATILVDLACRGTRFRSLALQHDLVTDLSGKTRLLEHPARSADFAVLRSPQVPALLIETGFLSNRHDETLLRTPHYRHHLADKLASSVTESLSHWARL